ncbi:YgdI/YgdR family lipoprotein [Bordetella sp. FB-8]|uniref:YgdI/YgdR family lipoprotein n=1 Tax=Bordetella sp. FB-8 TaxID=1159870 RepID=UPI00035C4647|nr:YgdI/YgdR family lipoprotein [Bordetella sp. FB-8]
MSPKTLILTAAMSCALVGCATPTVVHEHDGSTIITPDRPIFNKKTGFYEYKDKEGRVIRINKDDIQSIEDVD